MVDLGSTFSPASINDSGQIAGTCGLTGPCVSSNGTLQDLNDLIPGGSPYVIDYATGVDDNGQIVAKAQDTATSQLNTLLLTPN